MKVKGIAASLLSTTVLLVLIGCSQNNPTGKTIEIADSDTSLLSIADHAGEYAAQQLAEMKEGPAEFYEPLGFTETEIAGSELGSPFKIYLFDDNGQFMESETDNYVFPMLFNGDIVGIIETAYLPDSSYDSDFSFTFGKAYGNELNSLKSQNVGDDLIIGNLGTRLLFAIDGERVSVIKHNYGEAIELTEEEIDNVLASFRAAVENPVYFAKNTRLR